MSDGAWRPGNELAEVVDGVEAVVWRRANGEARAIGAALRSRVAMGEGADAGGRYSRSDVTWHLPVEVDGEGPALGEVIEDGRGTKWTVLGRRLESLGTRWACAARALAIAHGLTERVSIERAVIEKGAHGEPVARWQVFRADLWGRVQRISGEVAAEHARRVTHATHLVYVEEVVLVGHQDRVVHGAQVLAVVGYSRPERLGELMCLEARETPWPWGPVEGAGG